MKTGIHPTYHEDATVTCSCGAKYTIGSTMPEFKVEICSNCHPFYTGKQKLVDTEGRVDKFYSRQKAAEAKMAAKGGAAALAAAPVKVEEKAEEAPAKEEEKTEEAA